jgi:hypothetical protein
MEDERDERRKFLMELLAAGGAAALFPELLQAEAAQTAPASTVKLQPPIQSRILKRETIKGSAVESTYLELELTGSNNVQQVFTAVSSKTATVTSTHMTVATHENGNPTPIEVSEVTVIAHRKPVDANHFEVTGTLLTADGRVTKIGPTIAVHQNLATENLTDEELISRFLTPKLAKVQP